MHGFDGFFCSLEDDVTHWCRSRQASRRNRWDSSICSFHSCSCSGARRDEVSGRTRSDLDTIETSNVLGIVRLPTDPKAPNTYLDYMSFQCILGNTCICWGRHTLHACSRVHTELVKQLAWKNSSYEVFEDLGFLSNLNYLLQNTDVWVFNVSVEVK